MILCKRKNLPETTSASFGPQVTANNKKDNSKH